jgi:polyisoprenoid-binding protein YceI
MKQKAKKLSNRAWILSMAAVFAVLSAAGQANNYRQSGTTNMIIAGTSTMHDWTMTSTSATYNATFEVTADGIPTKLNMVSFTMLAESLKSHEKAMDKNAYKSLNTEKYKDITFQLTSSKITGKTITCNGNLTISGTTKPVEVDVTYETKSGNLVCKGSKKIKMTDFKVEPPSFMFGTIKTGDEITITFDVTLSQVKL